MNEHFKFCLVILEDCHIWWQIVENISASIKCTVFENKLGCALGYEDDAYSLY
jgi:hypothetical protein